ncbi:hypothetical protein MPB2EB_0757 [Mycoavidus sp. B2-EB]|nr:hypothetical protein MPB2EB_0757 [Mycoavidus sp. B2-EB]
MRVWLLWLALSYSCLCGMSTRPNEGEEYKRGNEVGVQPKLKANEPYYHYEQEADRITDKSVHSDALDGAFRLSSIHAVTRPITGVRRPEVEDSGHPLEADVQHAIGQKIGYDFGPWKSGKRGCGEGCKRPNRENIDFPNTYISRITINLSMAKMSLTWNNPRNLLLPTRTYNISAGAGRCCHECHDETVSNTEDTLCTPKGTFIVHSKAPVLIDYIWAKNPIYFGRNGIAIHSGPLPGYPATHGCIRTEEEGSAIVHDNSLYSAGYAANPALGLEERRTQVIVEGTWKGSRCYLQGGKEELLVLRKEVCCLKSKGGGSGPPEKSPTSPKGSLLPPKKQIVNH